MIEMALPRTIFLVDHSAFGVEGNDGPCSEAARALYKASRDLGFVQVTGHKVDPALLQEAFEWLRKCPPPRMR